MSANKPMHEVRLGLIKASIWLNQTRVGDRYNVTLTRLFRNGDVWKESTHFGRDDLLQAAKVLDMAHTWIHQQERNDKATGEQHDGNSKRGPDLAR